MAARRASRAGGSARSTARAACARRAGCPAAARRRSAPTMPAWSCTTSNSVDLRYDASAWYPSYQGLPRSRGSGGSGIGETSLRLRARAARREQRDVVAGVDEAVGEQRHDELDAAVAGRRHGEPHRCDDGDAHRGQGTRRYARRTRVRKRGEACGPATCRNAAAVDDERERDVGGADGIVTLVEGSSFCISSRSGEIDPDHPQGLFFRDTRFVSELRLRSTGRRPSRSPRPPPIRSARCSCCAAHPSRGPRRLAPRGVPPPLHRAGDARGPRDRELRRGSRVLLGRARGRRRLRRPLRGQGGPGPQAGQARRRRRRRPGASRSPTSGSSFTRGDARRLHAASRASRARTCTTR